MLQTDQFAPELLEQLGCASSDRTTLAVSVQNKSLFRTPVRRSFYGAELVPSAFHRISHASAKFAAFSRPKVLKLGSTEFGPFTALGNSRRIGW